MPASSISALQGRPVKKVLLRPFQVEVYEQPHKFRVVAAGRRVGKSYLCAAMAVEHALSGRYKRVLIVGPTAKSVKNSMWHPVISMAPSALVKKTMESQERAIYFMNGSDIHFMGSDRPDGLRGMSTSPTMVIIDELSYCVGTGFYSAIMPMSADKPEAKFVLVGTPAGPGDEFHRMFMRGQNNDAEDKEWWSCQHTFLEVYPHLTAEVEEARRMLDPIQFAREYEASFANTSLSVFRDFSMEKHVGRDLKELTETEPAHVAVDFNISIMAASVCAIRERADGTQYVDVLHQLRGAANTEQLCKDIRALLGHDRHITVYPDPSGNQRSTSAAVGETDFSILKRAGFTVKARPRTPPIKDSVNCVNAMILSASGDIRLRVHQRCGEVIDSLLNTRWLETLHAQDKPTIDKKGGKEHFSDALRYFIELMFPIKHCGIRVARSKLW